MLKSFGTSLALIVLGSAAAAQSTEYFSTDGDVFSFEQNQHGAVLTSIEPTMEILATNDTSPKMDIGDIVYVGRFCDAFSNEHGEGSWSWSNGGFIVEFPDLRIAFPGQAIDIVPGNRCRL